MRLWLSWYSRPEDGPFTLDRPWWVSGMRLSDEAETIVADVEAEDEAAAWEVVRQAYDIPPDQVETRFIRRIVGLAPWEVPGGRFGVPT